MELIIGKVYKCTTASNKEVIPLHKTSEDRAIFFSSAFEPTPFISWWFKVTGPDTIELCHGDYYRTLPEAIKGRS